MRSADEFIRRLMGFGLTEKEAQCYFYLLKYGPKTPSPLARALHTYREEVHRTLNSLIAKGFVRPSLSSPSVYTAVDLDVALKVMLVEQERELHEMNRRKRELQQLARQRVHQPSTESSYRMLKSVREVVNAGRSLIQKVEKEILWVGPQEGLSVISRSGMLDVVREKIALGVRCRGITDISYSTIPLVHEALGIGERVRHFPHYSGVYFNVFDRTYSLSAINMTIQRGAPDEAISMLWSDDGVFASYLVATYELLWEQAVPAEERIEELLRKGPPQADR